MDDNKNAMRNTRKNKKIDRKIMGKSNEIEQNR